MSSKKTRIMHCPKCGHKLTFDLTPKQEQFVYEVVNGASPTEAVERVYNTSTRHSANSLAQHCLNNPRVRAAITDIIKSRYPNLEETVGNTLHHIMTTGKDRDRLKAIETFLKIFGWSAPTRHERLSANIKVNKDDLKLPK